MKAKPIKKELVWRKLIMMLKILILSIKEEGNIAKSLSYKMIFIDNMDKL